MFQQPKLFTLSLMVANVEWLTTVFNKEREYIFLGHLDFMLTDQSDQNEPEQLIKMSYVKEQDLSFKTVELEEEEIQFDNSAFLTGEP